MYTTIGKQQIYYQKVGKGRDLAMLHGWGQDVSSFWGVAELLKNDFTLWLIDLPGFGRSDLPQKPFTVSDYAEVIRQFILRNKIRDAVLLGHSLGGRIAIKLAASQKSHPGDVISKLILEDAAGIKPKRDLIKFFIYPAAKIFRHLPNFLNLKNKLRHWFYKSLKADYINAGPLKETLTNILEEDLTPDLPRITTETLLIWGEKDPTQEASLSNGKKMYKLIPNARLEVIENVGHFPHLENPERFVYWIKEFIL